MASKSISREYKLKWQLLSPAGPTMANHVGCLIGGCMYVHGGISRKGSTDPLNKLFKMDLSGGIWEEVRCPGSPALSHHVCVVLQDRYMLLIGGWNGKRRTSSVFGYDTSDERWISCRTSGFPEGAGLSSHSANLLTNGDILIVGREGSLRLQRRSGQAFMLRGDIQRQEYKWSDVPLGVDSRSGHTSHIIGQTLISVGGRNDKPIELHNGFKGAYSSAEPSNAVIRQVWDICKHLKSMSKPPGGRTHHVGIDGGGGVLVHGGDTFDGRREPVGEMFMLAIKPHIHWYKLGDSGISRAGHVTCSSHDKVVIHGGMSGKQGTIHSDCYELQVSQVS